MDKCALFILSLCTFFQSFGQYEEEDFKRFTTADGLSNNFVTGIEQDPYGYIWISTTKGLNRFDGNNFQRFYSDSSRNSLPQDAILRLKWLGHDQLAAMTFYGLHLVNARTLQSRNLIIPQLPKQNWSLLNKIADATSDKKGNIFLSTPTGFYEFNNKDELVFRYDHLIHKSGLAFGWNIIQVDDNTVLLSTFEGLYLYYIREKDIHPVGDKDDAFYRELASDSNLVTAIQNQGNSLTAVIPVANQYLFFDLVNKTKSSLKTSFPTADRFDGSSGSAITRITDSIVIFTNKEGGLCELHFDQRSDNYRLDPKLSLENYFCSSLLSDNNNRLWIGTNKGLLFQKRPGVSIDKITFDPNGFKTEILSMSISNNKVFAGTHREGLLVIDEEKMTVLKALDFSRYKTNQFPNMVLRNCIVHHDTLFTATAGVWVNTKNFTHGLIDLAPFDSTYEGIELVFKDSRNDIWLKKAMRNIFFYRGDDGKFRKIDYRKELSHIGNVSTISEDLQGNLWFAGWGIMRFNYHSQKFDLVLDSFPSTKVENKSISTNLLFDNEGKIYFGVNEIGLVIYDSKEKKITHLTRQEGLPDNNIHAAYLHNGKLWLGTESGLASYDLSTKKVFSYGTADGIPADGYVTYLFAYDSVHRKLYGAFGNMIYRFDPDSLTKNNSPPRFSIENLIVPGKETFYHPGDEVNVSYKNNNIVIGLASVNFEDAFQQQFAYRLINKGNEPWQDIGSQRSIVFSNLSSGKHRLQVKVYTRNGNWPEQVREISIIIHPPFWKTPWFYACSTIMFFVAFFYLHRRRINHIRQKANLDKLLVQSEMKALHAQMNPHFIFNCLNSIREMVLNNENRDASHYLSKFAQLIRMTLNQSSKQFISLRDTVDYLTRYLEMEQVRNHNFNYNIVIDERLATNEIMIPPMLIQPFLENAIWHGSQPGKELQLRMHFLKKEEQLICIVDDNGIGIETSLKNKNEASNGSIGIINVKERIQMLNEKYNLNSSISIEDKSRLVPKNGTGTIVKLYFPVNALQSRWRN